MHVVHLSLEERLLPPCAEWKSSAEGWCFVRVTSGVGYLLANQLVQPVSEGHLIVWAGCNTTIRASQIGELKLEYFNVCPELLDGLFNLSELRRLELASADSKHNLQTFAPSHPMAAEFAKISHQVSSCGKPILRVQLLSLAVAVWGDALSCQDELSESVSAHERFLQVVQALQVAEIQQTSPGELARRCGCSERHFSRLFVKHFGVSVRTKQMEIRLQKAQQLLRESNRKIINIALDCGFQSLGLFNSMFKKRFGATPSKWRERHSTEQAGRARPRTAVRVLMLFLLCCFSSVLAQDKPSATPATNAAPAASQSPAKPAPTFAVLGYEISGNTVLPEDLVKRSVTNYTGAKVTLDQVRQALSDLQLAYRNRGYLTVSVTLPQQQLTNGIVKVKVVEGTLAEIKIIGNRYFSSNNITRALPNLRTNIILNSQLFQYDLDQANANRDRTLYPVIGPGPEPGTSSLTLKTKDRLPLHGRLELNNQSTPQTPDLRINGSLQYNNLWQLEHQAGVQYLFSPEAMKEGDKGWRLFDQPLVSSYSGFYRMPLSMLDGNGPSGQQMDLARFGYNEATRRFELPAPSGRSEVIFFGSRSESDTGNQVVESTLTPAVLPPQGGLQVASDILNQTLSVTEDLGTRLIKPLPEWKGWRSSLQAGLDYKYYQADSIQMRSSHAALYIPPVGATSGPPFVVLPAPETPPAVRQLSDSVSYLPLTLGLDASKIDKWGSTSFSINNSFNFADLLGSSDDFKSIAHSTKANGNYYVVNLGVSREQRIYGEWGLSLRANGQWANEPLIGNEQFSLGGLAGVRGYRDGREFGDTGWRVLFEPHTPTFNVGVIEGTSTQVRIRGSIFTDYGERYLIDPAGRDESVALWGAGMGFSMSVGNNFDLKAAYAWPLLSTPDVEAGVGRVYFSVGAQF